MPIPSFDLYAVTVLIDGRPTMMVVGTEEKGRKVLSQYRKENNLHLAKNKVKVRVMTHNPLVPSDLDKAIEMMHFCHPEVLIQDVR